MINGTAMTPSKVGAQLARIVAGMKAMKMPSKA
jgi:hypothetical protein